jgi:hypothetical protein
MPCYWVDLLFGCVSALSWGRGGVRELGGCADKMLRGFCGNTTEHCSAAAGCQAGFGACTAKKMAMLV